MAEKITKRMKFERLLAVPEVANDPMLRELVENEIGILDRKSANRKSTSADNTAVRNLIVNALVELAKPVTVSEILEVPAVAEYEYIDGKETKKLSASKVTSVLSVMKKDNEVVNTKDKKKSLYALAD